MENYMPEIALKEPKADPRTVLLRKQNFLETSSDHIPELKMLSRNRWSIISSVVKNVTTGAYCDRLRQDETRHHALEMRMENSQMSCTSYQPVLLKSVLEATKSPVVSTSSSQPPVSSTAAVVAPTSVTSSLYSSSLVKFSQSCHLNKLSSLNYVNDSLNNLYKFQTTKLLLILVFIYCAISSTYLPQTHAIPVPRTKTSGQRLILHSNVYRERYHQNLLKNHRYHQQRQQQQLYQQQKQILQDFHRYHQKQRQEQQLEQRSSYIAPILRKVHRQQLRHHHLHQRAAPTSTSQIQTRTMNYCENNQILGSLPKQLYMSLDTMKNMMENYLLLLDEPNGYSQKAEEWSKHHLDMRNADNQDTVAFKNEIHQRLHDFFVNLHNFYHLLRSTRGQIRSLPNERDISDSLRQHFDNFLREIEYTKQAAEEVLRNLQIDIPALGENIEYNRHLDSSLKVRDFIVFKEIIEEMEAVHNLLNTLCYAQLK